MQDDQRGFSNQMATNKDLVRSIASQLRLASSEKLNQYSLSTQGKTDIDQAVKEYEKEKAEYSKK